MPSYHRESAGNTYFFTVITYRLMPILNGEKSTEILRSAWKTVAERFPFSTVGICLMPDHIHTIWTLPEDDQNNSLRWKEIKRQFTKRYLAEIGPVGDRNRSREKRGEAAVWQRRFWEHTIRDDDDLARHINYIHFNPVKHGLVTEVEDWRWSSFHRFMREGYYGPEWRKSITGVEDNEFGE